MAGRDSAVAATVQSTSTALDDGVLHVAHAYDYTAFPPT
jgi:hypothetical protein